MLNLKNPMNKSIWLTYPPKSEAKKLSLELGLPFEICQILVNRNIRDLETAHAFLFGTLDDLYDPYLMKGMREAVARIKKAIAKKERVIIFGDYDVDGILSVVMLLKALEELGAEVSYFIPHRLKDGYGLKEKHIDFVLEKEAGLVISADCGIKALEFVKKAKEKGVDVIITDHHLPGEEVPQALAILNPVLEDAGYPDQKLASVGVVFKLIQALFGDEGNTSSLPHYLKLVSIGTIADIARLRGENRLFVKYGLKTLENISNIGLKSLIDICGLSGKRVSVGDVGFRIGPRINAAGRMGMADLAVKLFLARSLPESLEIVNHIDFLNSKRQKIEEKVYDEAIARIEKRSLDKRYKFFILGCEEWHRGVIGIVSSKLKDTFHRPVILFSYEDGKAYGSGRSISEFSLIHCLDELKDFFLNYGGHNLAAGCVILQGKIVPFKKAVNSFANSRITEEQLKRKIYLDIKIDFGLIDSNFVEKFLLLSPFGVGNPKPVFLTEKVEVVSVPQLIQDRHTKFLARQKGRTFEALGWEKPDLTWRVRKGDIVDLAYSLHFSEYLGEEKLSLSLEDVKE